MQLTPPPPPDHDNRGFRLPLQLNAGLVLLIAGLAYVGNRRPGEALLVLGLSMLGLTFLNLLALLVAALAGGRSEWVKGFALSMLLVLLIGLGSCGLIAVLDV